MRLLPPLSLWFKTQVATANVALAARTPQDGARFARALEAVRNGEHQLARAWWRGALSINALTASTARMTQLRGQLGPPVSPSQEAQRLDALLLSIQNQRGPTRVQSAEHPLAQLLSPHQRQQRLLARLDAAIGSNQLTDAPGLRAEVTACAALWATMDGTTPMQALGLVLDHLCSSDRHPPLPPALRLSMGIWRSELRLEQAAEALAPPTPPGTPILAAVEDASRDYWRAHVPAPRADPGARPVSPPLGHAWVFEPATPGAAKRTPAAAGSGQSDA